MTRPLQTQLVGSASRSLGVLFAATLIVLVIACANVSNLFAVRAESRRHELAIRTAIGAQRGQIVRSQMSEVLIVAFGAAILAAALAWFTLPIFVSLAPGGVPRLSDAATSRRSGSPSRWRSSRVSRAASRRRCARRAPGRSICAARAAA